ncbi:MAG: PQQ-binding-like beta-propeller repeat protein [Armatimonadota bacterium]
MKPQSLSAIRGTAFGLMLTGVLGAAAWAADWPQWRGPERSGVSKETGLLKAWPAEGPTVAWKSTGRGEGHSTPSVANGRIFGMGLKGSDEVVWALDAKTGKEVWSTRVAPGITLDARQGGDGSRGTPTVDGDKLYALGVAGDLVCVNIADGKLVWQKNLVKDFGGSIPSWGYSESPLVDGGNVVATPGGTDATLVALDKKTGTPVWKSQVPSGNRVAYSSCIAADLNGQRQYIQFLAGGVVGVAAKTGKFLWRYDAPASRGGINCSTPIYRDGFVFAASAYQNGGGLAKLTPSTDGSGTVKAEEVYFTKEMQNHHGGMVLVGDYLYGFDNSNLTCLEFKTGKMMWADRSVGKGSLTYADGLLICRSERGPVALVEASPKGYVEKGRFEQTDRSRAASWPYPVVANGRLYLRDQENLLCYDIKQAGTSAAK